MSSSSLIISHSSLSLLLPPFSSIVRPEKIRPEYVVAPNGRESLVEVGNRKNITQTVKNYADSVVQQAVAEGAKLLQDRIGAGGFKSVSQTIQRLEEAAVSYRGHERALLITRWLTVLKEIDSASESSVKDNEISSEEVLASDEAKRREWV